MCRKLFFLTSFVVVLALATNANSQILFEYWFDIPTVDVSALTSDADYPDNPDQSEWRDRFEGPVDWADNYGSRARGFLTPPADGDYTFWISGDDFEELYLSTDDDPANAVLIAEVPGWTSYLEWDKYPEQQSVPVTLVGGTEYYIEGIMKEAGGGDSMTVGWAGPEIGADLKIIDGAYLSPLIRGDDDPLPALYAKARNPSPADGTVDVIDSTMLWTPGHQAVSSNVYLSTSDAIDDVNDLVAETDLNIYLPIVDLGTTYYWRIDSVDADGAVVVGDVWSFSTMPLEAHFPSPADAGTWLPLDAQLSWTPGKDAIMHDVYFGTDEAAIAAADPATFQGKLMDTSFDPGALESITTYYWKVDEFALGVTNPGMVWSFTTLDIEVATDPDPADGAVDVADSVTLSWSAGEAAATYDVYLSTDANALGDAVTVAEAAFTPDATLDWDTTYYWAVDVNDTDGLIHPAHEVWSFKVADFLIIDDATTTLDYDNTADPFVTEAMWDTPADLTINGARNLSFQFQGAAPPAPPEGSLSLDEATGIFTVNGSGADVWGSSDQFHYGYRMLSGDADIIARVVSNGTGSNNWAKGGVMIRETLDPGSKHALMALTGGDGGGKAFQHRPVADERSMSAHGGDQVAPPLWVRLTRVGNVFTGYYSVDGVDWVEQENISLDGGDVAANPATIEMAADVYIGLFVTSHAAGEVRTYEFGDVGIDGDISADNLNTDIGIGGGGNDPAPIYAALEDSTGAVAMVAHPDPAATNIEQMWKCEIPITDFDGVDLTDVVTLTIGVGDGEAGGTGTIDIKDIRVTKPVVIMEPGDITMPGDNVKGVPDEARDGNVAGWPGGEHPALSVDDDTSTKYLHFKGEVEPTGIKVTPSAKQVVNGITFTTANDAVERDPVTFELYGSNEGIDGPYELIASGEIVDFNDPNTPWPRFTMNTTPITFENDMAYAHYQVMFPTVRDAASANSMQIAEIELITDIPVLDNGDTLDAWDHDNSIDKWDGSAPGAGNPGGVAALVEDEVTFVRIQDTGDPRDYGDTIPTGKTNYSLYLTQPINNGLDGARIEVRVRIATTGTLDAWRKDGGGMGSTGLFDWPAGGLGGSFNNGTHEDYGRGNIDIAEKGVGVIALVPSTSGLMVGNKGNKVSVDDATDWNTYVINIAANGDGKYAVSVSANGKLAESFTVTPGTGTVESGTYIAIGSPDLAGKVATGFDVDYISVVK
ncbi:MAG: hypothetical protein GY774_09585 [Planctomycetes bacterium]|nr:hypothetical protein [Planctomycetota bacterium]